MGGSSSYIAGYKNYMGSHVVLCHGPIDYISRITVDDKIAWQGYNDGSIPLYVNAETILGGDDSEGGISGYVDVAMGRPDQEKSTYLQNILGALIPAFRGVCSLIFKQVYVGNSKYPKPWIPRGTRTDVRDNGAEQWYIDKASIPLYKIKVPTGGAVSGGWRFSSQTYPVGAPDNSIDAPDNYLSVSFNDDGWSIGDLPAGNHNASNASDAGFSGLPKTIIGMDGITWIRNRVYFAVAPTEDITFRAWVDNYIRVWVNGVQCIQYSLTYGDVIDTIIGHERFHAGVNQILIEIADDQDTSEIDNTYFDLQTNLFDPDGPGAMLVDVIARDMNPAHIIRECDTSLIWGAKIPESKIDDDSFMAAADTLFNESMGISLIWDSTGPVVDFIEEIKRHIDGVHYVDEVTGLINLRLIRDDYEIGDLTTLDDSTVISIGKMASTPVTELVNSVTVVYWDSVTGKDASVTVSDPALVQMQGRRRNTKKQYPGFTNADIATRVAMRDLRALSSSLLSCELVCTSNASALKIGDPFIVNLPYENLQNVVMRVVDKNTGDGINNTVRITCTQDIFALPATPSMRASSVSWDDPRSPAQTAPQRLLFELAYYDLVIDQGEAAVNTALAATPQLGRLGVGATRPSGNAINAVFAVDAGAGYIERGTLVFSPTALLQSDIDEMETVIALESASDLDLVDINTRAIINGEQVLVTGIDLELMTITVGRAVLDTVPTKHFAGDRIYFFDTNLGLDSTDYVDSETLDVRVMPITSGGQLALSEAATDTLVMDSRAIRPYPPANVKLNDFYFPASIDGDAILTWVWRNRLTQTGATLLTFTDAGVTPEDGTTVSLEVYDSDTETLIYANTGITDLTTTIAQANFSYNNRLELWSVRDGYDSWQRVKLQFTAPVDLEDWTPAAAAITPAFWINDMSAITVSGSAVIDIADLSRRGLTATQSSSTKRPTVNAIDLNGLRTLSFDGTQYLNLPSEAGNIYRKVPAGWIFAVYYQTPADVSATERPIISFAAGSTSGYRAWLGASDSSHINQPACGGRRIDTDSYSGIASANDRSGAWVMIVGTFDYIGRTIDIYVNGNLEVSGTGEYTSGTGISSDTISNLVRIGANGVATPTQFFKGKIAELGCIQGNPGVGEIDRMFGYLAWHWGLQANLDSGHPFADAAPQYYPGITPTGFAALLANNTILYMGHRGVDYLYPESTNLAFANSMAAGELLIDTDIVLTSDGKAVCSHDTNAAYVTTSTSNYSSIASTDISALVVDADVWFGQSFTGLEVVLFNDLLANYLDDAVIIIESKTPGAMSQAISDIAAAGASIGDVVLSSFDNGDISTAVASGNTTIYLSSATDIAATAEAADVDYICYNADVSPGFFSNAIARGFDVFTYTTDRRIEAQALIKNGIKAIYTDDPTYMRATAPLATADAFDLGWMPGMVAGGDDSARPALAERGRMIAPDYWGYTETADTKNFCLMGWACPIKSDNGADDYTIDFKITFDDHGTGGTARWAALHIAAESRLDTAYLNNNTDSLGYVILFRKNGTMDIYRHDIGSTTNIASQTAAAFSTGDECRFKVIVSPTAITVQRLDSGGSVVASASASDTVYRGGYIHLGKYGLACKFREISIT